MCEPILTDQKRVEILSAYDFLFMERNYMPYHLCPASRYNCLLKEGCHPRDDGNSNNVPPKQINPKIQAWRNSKLKAKSAK